MTELFLLFGVTVVVIIFGVWLTLGGIIKAFLQKLIDLGRGRRN